MDLDDITLEELHEIEDAYPEDFDEDATSLDILSHMGIARRVSIWTPEAGHIRIFIGLNIDPEELVFSDSEPETESEFETEEEPHSPRSPTNWPARLPGTSLTRSHRDPENAARI